MYVIPKVPIKRDTFELRETFSSALQIQLEKANLDMSVLYAEIFIAFVSQFSSDLPYSPSQQLSSTCSTSSAVELVQLKHCNMMKCKVLLKYFIKAIIQGRI